MNIDFDDKGKVEFFFVKELKEGGFKIESKYPDSIKIRDMVVSDKLLAGAIVHNLNEAYHAGVEMENNLIRKKLGF